MIGALAAMEEHLGELWGHDVDESQLTSEQKKVRKKWLDARDQVLDVGANAQKIAVRAVNSHAVEKFPYYKEFD